MIKFLQIASVDSKFFTFVLKCGRYVTPRTPIINYACEWWLLDSLDNILDFRNVIALCHIRLVGMCFKQKGCVEIVCEDMIMID